MFTQQEIVQTVQAANTVMKKTYRNVLPLFIVMFIMSAVVGNVLPRVLPGGEEQMICRSTNVCPVMNISMEEAPRGCNGDGCQVYCCRKQSKKYAKACSPDFDKRKEYTKRIQSGESVKFNEKCCLPEVYPDNCVDTSVEMSGNGKNEGKGMLALKILVGPLMAILMVFVPICLMLKNQTEVKKVILETFEPWKARGIRMEYMRPRKHSPGALYFHMPHVQHAQPQVIQPQQQTSPYAQQPGQPAQVVMVQRQDGVFYNQAPPAIVIAQQGAQEPKQ